MLETLRPVRSGEWTTYSIVRCLRNAEGKSTYVTFHWKPKFGMQSVVWNEALEVNGAAPDMKSESKPARADKRDRVDNDVFTINEHADAEGGDRARVTFLNTERTLAQ